MNKEVVYLGHFYVDDDPGTHVASTKCRCNPNIEWQYTNEKRYCLVVHKHLQPIHATSEAEINARSQCHHFGDRDLHVPTANAWFANKSRGFTSWAWLNVDGDL